ncbi:MAG: hypothetical protein K9M98_09780 [Cephaloticoccus sp.]|nr:hypothetical protein [Cephaloticoccus sp.]MCF7760782.1 hypothetical protein [Cephaloticoccus sp.]
MTTTKFTELLNLYLDHEINLEDAAKLEAEIQHNPVHREIYRQYCRMHKGCTLLARDFVGATEPTAPKKIVVGAGKSRSQFTMWTTGLGLAAAAGFAVVLMTGKFASKSTETLAATPAQAAGVQMASNQAAPLPTMDELPVFRSTHSELHPVFTPTLVTMGDQDRSVYVNDQTDRFDWMDHVNLASPQEDAFSFQVRPAEAETPRTLRSHRPMDGRVEMTAFQFQR